LEDASSNKEKGDRFETFVRTFFMQIPDMLIFRNHPFNIGWTDLDVIIRNKNKNLEMLGDIIVVQCKNLSSSISWKHVAEAFIQALVYREHITSAILATTSMLSEPAWNVIDILKSCGNVKLYIIEGEDWEMFFEDPDMTPEKFLEEIVLLQPKKQYHKRTKNEE